MQHLFVHPEHIQSPRWRLAFPDAQCVLAGSRVPSVNDQYLVWLVLSPDFDLSSVSNWVSAGAKVIVLDTDERPQVAKQMLALGASGYLHYLANVPVLQQAAQVVSMNGLWLGVDLMRQLVFATAQILKEPTASVPQLDLLSARELSVANLVAAGLANKEIARELEITERTVKAHLGAVFEKLKVRDRLQLVLVMSGK